MGGGSGVVVPGYALHAVKANHLVIDFFSFAALVPHHDRATDAHGSWAEPPKLDDFFIPLRIVFECVGPHELKDFRHWPVDVPTRTPVVNHDVTLPSGDNAESSVVLAHIFFILLDNEHHPSATPSVPPGGSDAKHDHADDEQRPETLNARRVVTFPHTLAIASMATPIPRAKNVRKYFLRCPFTVSTVTSDLTRSS